MPQPKYYCINQALPKPWYKRHFFGLVRLFACLMLVTGFGIFGAVQLLDKNVGSSLSRSTSQELKVNKVQAIAEPEQENIVDVQSVLDDWSKEQSGQKWGVVVRSLDGPSFEGKINEDMQYEVSSLYPLYMTVPLFDAVPAKEQAKLQLSVNGAVRTFTSCVSLSIRINDMSCAHELSKDVNLSKANQLLASKSLRQTSITKNQSVRTTANDASHFLAQLRDGLLTGEAKDTTLRLLREHIGKGGIAKGCPGCSVSNITNAEEVSIQDSAIVQYKRGTYVISIFGGQSDYSKIAQLSSRIQQKIVEATN